MFELKLFYSGMRLIEDKRVTDYKIKDGDGFIFSR